MKSLEFLKPTLATTLAIVLAWLLSARPAQAGYIAKLQQVGPDVVATGSGAINLQGLTFSHSRSNVDPWIRPQNIFNTPGAIIYTGPTSSSVDEYVGGSGPTSFGTSRAYVIASSGSGDMVGIFSGHSQGFGLLGVPTGYVSGTALSDMAIYSNETFATLGVTPGTYVWKWGTGANQKFTLKILTAVLPATKITNISTRASVQTGQGVTIAGFIITGTAPKQVVIRGLGPTLTQSGVSGVLADPTLNLHDSTGSIVTSDDWQTASNSNQIPSNLRPSDSREAAILITLQPGNYTATLAGKNGTTGIGLVEVYDISGGGLSALTNASTRGFVGTDENVMIAGFHAIGSNIVVVRGLGPTLAQFGVLGALADPVVTLVDGNGNVVQTNNNWKNSQQAATIQATGKAPPNDLEAAILATVPAGNYSAILSGNGGGTGIGMIDVNKL